MNQGSNRIPFNSIISSAAILFIGKLLGQAIMFAIAVISARYLGSTGYGSITLGQRILMLIAIISGLGINQGIARYLPRYDDPTIRRGILWSGSKLVLYASFVSGVVLFVSAEPISKYIFNDPDLYPVIQVFAIAVPFVALKDLAVGIVQGLKKSTPKVLFENITQPIINLIGVFTVVFIGLGTLGIARAYVISHIAAGLVGLFYLYKYTPLFNNAFPKPMMKELLSFSSPLMISAATLTVFTNLDTILLAYFSTTESVGVYNAIYPIATLLTLTLSVFGFISFPIISEYHSKEEYEKMESVFHMTTKWMAILTLPAFLVLLFYPRTVISITFGREFIGGAFALSVLSLGFYIHTLSGLCSKLLISIGKTKVVMYDNLFVVLTNIILNVILIPKYGVLGAAISTTISYAIRNLLYIIQLYLIDNYLPFTQETVVSVSLSTIGAAVIFYILNQLSLHAYLEVLIFIVLFLIIFATVLYKYIELDEEESELVDRIRKQLV